MTDGSESHQNSQFEVFLERIFLEATTNTSMVAKKQTYTQQRNHIRKVFISQDFSEN